MDHLGESWAVCSPSAEMGMQGARESRRAGVSVRNPGQVWLGSTIHWVNTDGRIPSTVFFFLATPCSLQDLSLSTRIGPRPWAVKVLSPNHWTTRWGGCVLMGSSSPELAHTGQTVGGTSPGIAQSPVI